MIGRQLQFKQNLIGVDFSLCPEEGLFRLHLLGEILTAYDFDCHALFVKYQVVLPEGWVTDDSDQLLLGPLSKEAKTECNRLSSVTQTSTVRAGKAHFCFPIDLMLLGEKEALERPKITIEVCSVDTWGVNRVEGYCFLDVPGPGLHDLRLETFKPVSGIESLVREHFVGGSIRLKDPTRCGDTGSQSSSGTVGPISRAQYQTLGCGRVRLRLNVCCQDKELRQRERRRVKDGWHRQRVQRKQHGREASRADGGLIDTGQGVSLRMRKD